MHSVASFHISAVERDQIGSIMAAYLALEHAQIYRRLFVSRFGTLALALAIVGFGFHWLPTGACSVTLGLCLVAPTWAWVRELRCDWQLTRWLEQIPAAAAAEHHVGGHKKVIKSS